MPSTTASASPARVFPVSRQLLANLGVLAPLACLPVHPLSSAFISHFAIPGTVVAPAQPPAVGEADQHLVAVAPNPSGGTIPSPSSAAGAVLSSPELKLLIPGKSLSMKLTQLDATPEREVMTACVLWRSREIKQVHACELFSFFATDRQLLI